MPAMKSSNLCLGEWLASGTDSESSPVPFGGPEGFCLLPSGRTLVSTAPVLRAFQMMMTVGKMLKNGVGRLSPAVHSDLSSCCTYHIGPTCAEVPPQRQQHAAEHTSSHCLSLSGSKRGTQWRSTDLLGIEHIQSWKCTASSSQGKGTEKEQHIPWHAAQADRALDGTLLQTEGSNSEVLQA